MFFRNSRYAIVRYNIDNNESGQARKNTDAITLTRNIPKDRNYFETKTRIKILIIGRRIFYKQDDHDDPKGPIRHAKHCIVVLTTMAKNEDDHHHHDPNDFSTIVVRSFPEALHEAKFFLDNESTTTTNDKIDCWVVGGERLFQLALQHKSTSEVLLTIVENTHWCHFQNHNRSSISTKNIDGIDSFKKPLANIMLPITTLQQQQQP